MDKCLRGSEVAAVSVTDQAVSTTSTLPEAAGEKIDPFWVPREPRIIAWAASGCSSFLKGGGGGGGGAIYYPDPERLRQAGISARWIWQGHVRGMSGALAWANTRLQYAMAYRLQHGPESFRLQAGRGA